MDTDEKVRLCQNMSDHLLVLRTMLRLSQADLSKKIGVSRQTIVAMETQKRPISWNVFLALVLLFCKNPHTQLMLEIFGIYTKELDEYLRIEGDE